MARTKGFNALAYVNKVRSEKGLPKANAIPKPRKLNKEEKEKIYHSVISDLFPEALTEANYIFTPENQAKVARVADTEIKKAEAVPRPVDPNAPKRGRKPGVKAASPVEAKGESKPAAKAAPKKAPVKK